MYGNGPIKEALTFDDVILVPNKANFSPREVVLKTRLTKNININIPLISAAMDTVTGSRMAIAMAREGGCGIVHKSMSAAEQALEVDKVKRSEHGVIIDPFFLSPDHTINDANELMNRYKISGVPITKNEKLVGIVTNRDLRFESNFSKKLSEAMTKEPLITAKEGTTLDQAKSILLEHKIEKLPIVDDRGILKGLITIKDIEKAVLFPNSARDANGRLLVGAALGVTSDVLERAQILLEAKVDVVVLDSAHGHSKGVLETLVNLRAAFPKLEIIVGNVVTAKAAEELIKAGASAIKVGIGPGSICTTRVIAGVGVPQITAISDVAQVASKYDIPVIADGGIKYSGDITKAIAAGGDVVMLGSLLAGCEESLGENEIYHGRKFKIYRGMGSVSAMIQGSNDRYFQSGSTKFVPEGVESFVPYKGPLCDTVYQLLGGLRAGMGYCGTIDITSLKKDGEFIKVTSAGLRESHPHDVYVTKESPNYSLPNQKD